MAPSNLYSWIRPCNVYGGAKSRKQRKTITASLNAIRRGIRTANADHGAASGAM